MWIGTRSSLQKKSPCPAISGNGQHNFRDPYVPGKDMSVDEGMVKFKGRLFFKQYMPKKPVKYGIKVWMAAHSKTGYTSN